MTGALSFLAFFTIMNQVDLHQHLAFSISMYRSPKVHIESRRRVGMAFHDAVVTQEIMCTQDGLPSRYIEDILGDPGFDGLRLLVVCS